MLSKPKTCAIAFDILLTVLGMFVSAWQDDEEGIQEDDSNSETRIFLKHAENGSLDDLREMLEKDQHLLSCADEDGYTALHRAAYNDHVEVVSFLLERGADAEARTKQGWTPLHSAANWGNYAVVARLISHGVDVNARSNGSVTALHLAISSQCDDAESVFHCVRYLLHSPGMFCFSVISFYFVFWFTDTTCVDVSIRSGSGDTPVELARRTSSMLHVLINEYLNR
ncbi:unnamed protein product [Nippostrongylus brasiliensis]|uniref:Putative fetal globin-inducing factor (inferred by orthology to a S. mansoni protein) n=1 Tax=Nippostrongylus brasiliensis TaxID=27835 RepID=A0A0N4Y985_NIPBR|nr:unnamed protein product [Nippostrongylus brasiliensis]